MPDEIRRAVDRVDDEHGALAGKVVLGLLLAVKPGVREGRKQLAPQLLLHRAVIFRHEVAGQRFLAHGALDVVRPQHRRPGAPDDLGNDLIHMLLSL